MVASPSGSTPSELETAVLGAMTAEAEAKKEMTTAGAKRLPERTGRVWIG